ncbi:MAG: M16 family metallopeptidase [Thermodesulfobacteriota bacterium]
MSESYQKTVLENGVRIITERLPSRTVSVGIWVDAGARDEEPAINGCAHFVEHMLFKGTSRRGPQRIAQEFDLLGGHSNAFTSGETTSYYATVLDDRLEQVVDLLADMFLNSTFLDEEVAREREVVLQEISMVEDTPDDRIHELFSAGLWGDHPLGQTVLGTREVVSSMTSERLRDFVARFYAPGRVVIAATGNVDHNRFRDLWQGHLAAMADPGCGPARTAPSGQPVFRRVYRKKLEQAHLVIGSQGLPIAAPERYALYLLHVVLGGNMSSRLFQEIREKEGLAYSVYSYLSSFTDSGVFAVYLGVDPGVANRAMALVAKVIAEVCRGGVGDELLVNAREYAKAGIFLAAENMESRMTRLARNELAFGRYIPAEEVVAGFDAVSQERIVALANRLLAKPLSAVAMGLVKEREMDWSPLEARP